jgi:Leucine-rich repeat (LRR) protein
VLDATKRYNHLSCIISLSLYLPILLCTAGNELKGELPFEIGDLLSLEHLSLFNNQISGALPDRMRFLTELKFVAMESNQISGNVPDWINNLVNLEYLALGGNLLTGELPSKLDGLTNLKQVALDQKSIRDHGAHCPTLRRIKVTSHGTQHLRPYPVHRHNLHSTTHPTGSPIIGTGHTSQ